MKITVLNGSHRKQNTAAIQRAYAIGKPTKAAKAALLLNSASPQSLWGRHRDLQDHGGLHGA